MTDNPMVLQPKRTRGKGLRRSARQWEETFTRHMGEIIDKTKVSDVINVLPLIGCGYLGYKALGQADPLIGTLSGLVAYKLATSPGEVAAAAGTAGLILMGVKGLNTGVGQFIEDLDNKLDEGLKDVLDRDFEDWYPVWGVNPQCKEGYKLQYVPLAMSGTYTICVKEKPPIGGGVWID